MVSLEQAVEYLNRYKAKFPMDALRKQLLANGAAPDVVEEAIRQAQGTAPVVPAVCLQTAMLAIPRQEPPPEDSPSSAGAQNKPGLSSGKKAAIITALLAAIAGLILKLVVFN